MSSRVSSSSASVGWHDSPSGNTRRAANARSSKVVVFNDSTTSLHSPGSGATTSTKDNRSKLFGGDVDSPPSLQRRYRAMVHAGSVSPVTVNVKKVMAKLERCGQQRLANTNNNNRPKRKVTTQNSRKVTNQRLMATTAGTAYCSTNSATESAHNGTTDSSRCDANSVSVEKLQETPPLLRTRSTSVHNTNTSGRERRSGVITVDEKTIQHTSETKKSNCTNHKDSKTSCSVLANSTNSFSNSSSSFALSSDCGTTTNNAAATYSGSTTSFNNNSPNLSKDLLSDQSFSPLISGKLRKRASILCRFRSDEGFSSSVTTMTANNSSCSSSKENNGQSAPSSSSSSSSSAYCSSSSNRPAPIGQRTSTQIPGSSTDLPSPSQLMGENISPVLPSGKRCKLEQGWSARNNSQTPLRKCKTFDFGTPLQTREKGKGSQDDMANDSFYDSDDSWAV